LKLRAYIAPIQKYENNDATNLDLNTKARKETRKAHISSSYLDNNSFLVVSIDLAREIGPYKAPLPPVEPTEETLPDKPSKEDKKKADKKARESKIEKAIKPGSPGKKKRDDKESKKETKTTDHDISELNIPVEPKEEKPLYERAVYLFPYKCYEKVPLLLEAI